MAIILAQMWEKAEYPETLRALPEVEQVCADPEAAREDHAAADLIIPGNCKKRYSSSLRYPWRSFAATLSVVMDGMQGVFCTH
jgi:hypothetical protein